MLENKAPHLKQLPLFPWHSQRHRPEQRGGNTRAFLPFVGQSCPSAQRSVTLEEGGNATRESEQYMETNYPGKGYDTTKKGMK